MTGHIHPLDRPLDRQDSTARKDPSTPMSLPPFDPTILDPSTALTRAADLIARDGLACTEEVGLWDTVELDVEDYVDVAGALAVVCGYRELRQAEDEFLSAQPPHPVVAAVLGALDLDDVLARYAWTDELGRDGAGTPQQQAVEALRVAAREVSAR